MDRRRFSVKVGIRELSRRKTVLIRLSEKTESTPKCHEELRSPYGLFKDSFKNRKSPGRSRPF